MRYEGQKRDEVKLQSVVFKYFQVTLLQYAVGNTLPVNMCPVSPTAQVAVKEGMRKKKRPQSAFENASVKSKGDSLKCKLRANEADPRARGARPSHPPALGPGSIPWPGERSGQPKAPLRPSRASLQRCQQKRGCPGHLCCPSAPSALSGQAWAARL